MAKSPKLQSMVFTVLTVKPATLPMNKYELFIGSNTKVVEFKIGF